jgi:hypothetical protein
LTDQTFPVLVDAGPLIDLRVRKGCLLVSMADGSTFIGTMDELRTALPPNAQAVASELKTVVEHTSWRWHDFDSATTETPNRTASLLMGVDQTRSKSSSRVRRTGSSLMAARISSRRHGSAPKPRLRWTDPL